MSESNLNRLAATVRSSNEHLILPNGTVGPSLGEFWSWSMSDLVSNATRGVLAEYIVATALGINSGVRDEWAAWDLTWGSIKIEVKSAAYVQAWEQDQLSKITFKVPKTRTRVETRTPSTTSKSRHADVYVLCLLKEQNPILLDPINTDQWDFWVIPTFVLDARTRSQHSITTPTLDKEFQQCKTDFAGLKAKIEQASKQSSK